MNLQQQKQNLIQLIQQCFNQQEPNLREQSEQQINQQLQSPNCIQIISELLSEISNDFLEVQLSILLKRHVLSYWNKIESNFQLMMIEQFFY